MFNSIRRFYNQNRKQIILAVVIVVCVILMIRLANYFAEQNLKKQNGNNGNTSSQLGSKSPNVIHTDPIISDKEIDETVAYDNQKLINDFISACNDRKIDDAYNYLSSSCKNKIFPSIDEFTSKYYNPIFNTKKEYNIENWISSGEVYTYRITFVNDILSSGTISDNIEDYITVITEEGEKKLNVFRFINNISINKTAENKVIKIEVIDKDIYDDYEIYNIKATNKSENAIMINRCEDNDGIYVQYLGNDEKYTAFITEIYEQNLVLQKNQTKYLSIKINKIYNGKTNANNIIFSDIINNKDVFDNTEDKNNYTDISTLKINL